MSGWTAIVPIKTSAARKTRLSAVLNTEERVRLTEVMLRHMLDVLLGSPSIDVVAVLAVDRPNGWEGEWIADQSRGLNVELQAITRSMSRQLLVIHADLPALSIADVDALISAAEAGSAIAPDRHRRGTNAIAVGNPVDMEFAFGADSFARHRSILPDAMIMERVGLGLDIDWPDDLEVAIRQGYLPDDMRSLHLADRTA